MREIKFRGWDRTAMGMFHHGGFMVYANGDIYVDTGWDDRTCGIKVNDRFALMQYTGLKDKHGIEIYEGDIVSPPNPLMRYVVKFGQYDNGETYEDNESGIGWYLELHEHFTDGASHRIFGMPWYKGCLVIGNVYENPELLVPE